jgi:hypothetical protein
MEEGHMGAHTNDILARFLYPIEQLTAFDRSGAPPGAIIDTGNREVVVGAWRLLKAELDAGRLSRTEALARWRAFQAWHVDVESVRELFAKAGRGRDAITLAAVRRVLHRRYQEAQVAEAIYAAVAGRLAQLTPREQAEALADPGRLENMIDAAVTDAVLSAPLRTSADAKELGKAFPAIQTRRIR